MRRSRSVEARTASRLDHPNVVTIRAIGHEGGIAFIAMELVAGESLRERLARGAAVPRWRCRRPRRIAEALARCPRGRSRPRGTSSPRTPRSARWAGQGPRISDSRGRSRSAGTANSSASTVDMLSSDGSGDRERSRLHGARTGARRTGWTLRSDDLRVRGGPSTRLLSGRRLFRGGTGLIVLAAILAPGEPGPLRGFRKARRRRSRQSSGGVLRRTPNGAPPRRNDLALQLRDPQAAGTSSPGAGAAPLHAARKKATDFRSRCFRSSTRARRPEASTRPTASPSRSSMSWSDLPRLRVMVPFHRLALPGKRPARGGPRARLRAVLSRDG